MKYLLRGMNDMYKCYSMKKILATNKIKVEFTGHEFNKVKNYYTMNCFNGKPYSSSKSILPANYVIVAILEKQSDGSINTSILDATTTFNEFQLIPNEEYKLFLFFVLKTSAQIIGDSNYWMMPTDITYNDVTGEFLKNTGGISPTTGLMEYGVINHDYETSHMLTKTTIPNMLDVLKYLIGTNAEAVIESGIIRSDVLHTFAWQRDDDIRNVNFHYDYYGDYDKSKTHFILYDPSGSMIFETNNALAVIPKTLPDYGKYVYVFELFDFENNLLTSKTETYNALEMVIPLFNSERDQNNELKMEFNDLSLGNIITWSWDFGDNMGTSNDQNPEYTYLEQGSYRVKLTVSDGDVSKTFEQSIDVYAKTCNYELNKFYRQESCTKIVFEYDDVTLNDRRIIVTDFKGVELENILLSSTQTLVEYDIKSDGVYFITYMYDDNGTDKVVLAYPIYSLCDTRECYMKMLKKIQCEPATNCDGNIDQNELRTHLNSITGLLYLLDHYIKWDMIKFTSSIEISNIRKENIFIIQGLFNHLHLIVNGCGICKKDSNENCTNCK